MLKPYDSDLEYQSNGDIYYRPSEVTFSLLADSARDSYVGYLQTVALDSDVQDDLAIDHQNLYSYSGPTQKWTFYLNDSDDNWVFLKTDNATKTVVSSQVLKASTITANLSRNVRPRRLVQLFGYKEDSTSDLEYRYFDSNLSEFGEYTIFEKADKKFFLYDVNIINPLAIENFGDFTDLLNIDSSLRDRDSNGQLIDLDLLDSYDVEYTDSVYAARLIRLRPVESGIPGDSTQYYKFGFEIPINKLASEVDSLKVWWNGLHTGLRDYVNDANSLDHFNFAGLREASDSEFSAQIVSFIDSAVDSANIPNGAQLGEIARSLFADITGDSYPRSNFAHTYLDWEGPLWQKFYKYQHELITTHVVHRTNKSRFLDSSIAASVDSFVADSGFNAHISIFRDYLIRIDSI